MFVEFLADSSGGGAAASSPAVAESAEWQRSPSVEESDGFEIVRTAEYVTGPVQARVLLYLQHEPSEHRLAPELAGMIGLFQGTRHEVIRAIWEYVTVNKLQDMENPEMINCDKYMQQCFPGEAQLNFSEIPVKLNRLFLPLQPVELLYTIPQMGGQPAREIYDVWVQIEDGENEQIDLQAHKDLEPAIDLKRDDIARLKAEIGEARQKREFMLMFAKDPKEFLVTWLASQARETADEAAKGALTEEQRAANFYNTQHSKQAVYRYYGGLLAKRHKELK
jgi:SWI/SNF-related matrix-associated actin-dependent regulator of chromatin subfamily D